MHRYGFYPPGYYDDEEDYESWYRRLLMQDALQRQQPAQHVVVQQQPTPQILVQQQPGQVQYHVQQQPAQAQVQIATSPSRTLAQMNLTLPYGNPLDSPDILRQYLMVSRQVRGLPTHAYRGSNIKKDAAHIVTLIRGAGGEGLATLERREARKGPGWAAKVVRSYLRDLDNEGWDSD